MFNLKNSMIESTLSRGERKNKNRGKMGTTIYGKQEVLMQKEIRDAI